MSAELKDKFADFSAYLKTLTVKDLITPLVPVIQAPKETTLPQLLKTLLENKILSVPVWDDEEKRFIGFVDVIDLLSIVITFTEFKEFATLFSSQTVSWDDWISQENDVFANGTAYDASGDFTRRNPWKEVKENSELKTLFETMGDRKVHRVAVFNSDHSSLLAVLSQSKLITFLADTILTKYHDLASLKITDLIHIENNVIKVKDDSSVIGAYKTMLEHGVSGVPIVDKDSGRIRFALSVSDIKASLSHSIFKDILLPLEEYIAKISAFYQRDEKPICCTKDDTLGSILQMLLITKYHRIFVVDENEVPVGIISLSDILSIFTSHL